MKHRGVFTYRDNQLVFSPDSDTPNFAASGWTCAARAMGSILPPRVDGAFNLFRRDVLCARELFQLRRPNRHPGRRHGTADYLWSARVWNGRTPASIKQVVASSQSSPELSLVPRQLALAAERQGRTRSRVVRTGDRRSPLSAYRPPPAAGPPQPSSPFRSDERRTLVKTNLFQYLDFPPAKFSAPAPGPK